MKRILGVAVLMFVSCYAAFAQTNSCREIEIQTPELVPGDFAISAKAVFKENKQAVTSPIRWKIIRGGAIAGQTAKGAIEISTKDVKEGSAVTIIAETDDECRSLAMAAVSIEIRCFLPYTIDEYGKLASPTEEFARLDNVAVYVRQFEQTSELSDNRIFVFLEYNKSSSKNVVKSRIEKIQNYLLTAHKIKKEKLLFLISESEAERVKYQYLPISFAASIYNQPLIIKGEDFDKLQNFFQTKIQNSKK